jgi:hypothetical protein
VERYVRKIAVCRHAMPAPLGFALRACNKILGLVWRRGPSGTGFEAPQTRQA